MKKVNETKVACPNCGTEFAIADKTHVSIGVVIGKDANLGTIHPKVEGKSKATERIEALRAAGVDVSNLFSMTGANGGDFIVRNDDGEISILPEDDPIFSLIISQGTVPNGKLFRRWVMAQMFRMLSYEKHVSVTQQIRNKGYNYMWKQMEDELCAQTKMLQHDDLTNFSDRNHWFNQKVLVRMLEDYRRQLRLYITYNVKTKRCKGIPYKHIFGEDIFVSDIDRKVFAPIDELISVARRCTQTTVLYSIVYKFNRIRKPYGWNPTQCAEWLDAYKGSGAFFTMQNMIRFHGCKITDDSGKILSKDTSYAFLEFKSKEYEGEGWRMIGLLRKFLKDNDIDINKKRAEWASER